MQPASRNKERHTDAIYCQEHQVSGYLIDPSFLRCNQLSDKTFEVEMSKKTIRLDLPMQIVCFGFQVQKPHIWQPMTSERLVCLRPDLQQH